MDLDDARLSPLEGDMFFAMTEAAAKPIPTKKKSSKAMSLAKGIRRRVSNLCLEHGGVILLFSRLMILNERIPASNLQIELFIHETK